MVLGWPVVGLVIRLMFGLVLGLLFSLLLNGSLLIGFRKSLRVDCFVGVISMTVMSVKSVESNELE